MSPTRTVPCLLGASVLAAGVIIGTTAPALAATDDSLDQTVGSGEEIGDEQVVVTEGHVDVGPRLIDGQWQILARDDTTAPAVWRQLDDVVFHLGDAAVLPAPEEEQFAFIDAEAGADLYVVPQTENFDAPWVGWNSQDPEVVAELARGMTLRFHGMDGPGQFTLFLQSGNFDDAELLWSSDTSEAQDIWADTNTHVHGNWIFTEPGIYLLDVELTAELVDGTTASDRDILRFAVGQETDPAEAFSAIYPAAEGDQERGGEGTTTANGGDSESEADARPVADQDDSGSIPIVAIVTTAAVVLLGAVITVSTVRSRRARAEAHRESAREHSDD
ncbi:choice-of-anchor M domain-containing protein [Ruania halotolerans]|uniref:choice-of-anchor M domain-containing protein n=1 Tax=Ruania halotolerans TaxID=2897773 RepID=UPI001E2E59B5|nr:choice-of-anchor M domain-containing protein [Ruania halotolerans]UFU05372.1 choice-of-anchor M domain-containing protein [Ruania halotolerans]